MPPRKYIPTRKAGAGSLNPGQPELSARLSALIGAIYEAAIDAPRLQGVLDEMTWLVGADNGGISIVEKSTGNALLFVFTPAGVVEDSVVLGMYHALEPFRRVVIQREPGRFFVEEEASLLHELTRSEDYQRWLKASGNRSRASAYQPLGNDLVMFLGLARGEGRRRFALEEIRPLEVLLPHFAQAARINRVVNELTVMHDVAEERYGQLGVGVVLVSDFTEIVYTSRTARRILGLGLGVEVRDGRLFCEHDADQLALQRLIGAQVRIAGRPGLIGGESMRLQPRPDSPSPLSILAAPYQNRLEIRTLVSNGNRVLLLLFDPSYRAPNREHALQQLYGMSSSEASLATCLADGLSLEQIASDRGLSKETLRSRLKRIFAKTGTRRQSELLRLLLVSPALLEHRPAPQPDSRDAP